jgi:hypothetical protein
LLSFLKQVLAEHYLSAGSDQSVPHFMLSSFIAQLLGQNGSSSKGKKRFTG